MYGQGNYAPPFGQRLPAPPPPPLQQGPPAPHHPIAQQGHPSVLPPVVQHGIPAYGQASSAPHSQVPPSGMLSSGQSYLIPPPPPPQMHGSASVPHSFSTSQQNTQWTQNAHHISPQLPPIGHHPPPRMIPPPLPQGQPFYRGPIHPPQPGGVPNFQHMPLPPPPTSTSQYFMPSPGGPFIQSGHESQSPMGLLPPPPPPLPPPPPSSPPPGPPPLPPSSPPPTSSLPSSAPLLAASNLGNSSRKPSDVEAMASDLVDGVSDPQNSSDDGLKINNTEGDTHSAVGSLLKPGESSEGSLKLNLPSPPPRPAEENIVRKIEVLCHYIAKNGHKFEDMTRQKEFGNPEFDFLFGGEPGSDAAVAHEYFIWMKKKSSLTDELPEGGRKDDSSLRQSGSGSSLQLDAGASHSAVDSDMDMEDDITLSDEAPGICKTLGSANQESDLAANELDTREPLHPDDLEHISDKDAIPTNLISSGSSGLVEPEPYSESTVKRFHASPNENLKQYDALAAAGDSSVKVTSHSSNGASPFRLLQDYASDDSSENVDEPCVEDVSAAAVSPTNRAGARSSDIFLTNSRIKDLPDLKKGVGSSSMSVETSSLGIRSKSPAPYTELEGAVRKTDKSTGSGDDEQREDSPENHDSLDSGSSHGAFQEKDYLAGGGVDAAPEKTAKSQKENLRSNSNQVKVDEFGRLQRAGASDSDSDDLHYTRRRGKRGRSWSRSRSPKDRRRRRSPLRRREKRSRSRSRSPKKRSRSKSPSYRRGGEAGSDRSRRDRGQLPDCFDFLRGKCFRGASCRYFHDSDKVEGSRQQKGRQQHEDVSPILKISVKSVHQRDEADRPAMQLYQDVPGNSVGATQDGDVCQEANLVTTRTSDRPPSDICGESLVTDVVDCGITQGLSIQEQEMRDIQEEPVQSTSNLAQTASCLDRSPLAMNSDKEKLLGDISQGKPSSFGQMMDQRFQDKFSDPLLQNSDNEPQKDSSTSASAPAEASTIGSQLPMNEPLASQSLLIQSNPDAGLLNNTYSSDYTSSRESLPPIPAHLSHPQLPLPPGSQGINIPFPPKLPSDYSTMPSTAKYPSHSSSGENYTPYQAPMPYQHSHFSAPQTSSWNFLPPPPPRGPHAVSLSQFPQNQLPPGSDYSSQTLARPYAAELPIHSQVGEFPQGRYPPVQELDRRLSHTEEFRARTLPVNYSMTHQFGVSNLMGEDNARPPLHGLISSNSYAQINIHHQPGHFSRDSPSTRIRSLSSDILPPEELPLPSAEVNPYLPPYGLLGPEVNNASVNLGESGKINSRYSSDFLDRTQLSHLSDFGRSRISNHYNPYASTFDQPLGAMFSLNVLNQEKDTSYRNKYSGWSSLSHVPADGQGSGNLSARNLIPSPNSAQGVAQMLPKSGSDQYDPIYDSIEPSSSSFRRSDHSKKREANDSSDVMLRLSASNKPHDLAENSAQKETGTVALSASAENDEFGETADAEVGAVENGSPSDPIDLEKLAAGDIEIDQVNTPGKSKKKSKDSRSMKLFKVSLADFVKEVLKPSWRQGNMSKEAFKTIVKKTVDKVSGAMKSHQVPKSQAKINHYIDSSQRKLTKLVMGYVDKYVKV